jgi:hypothetical protein
VINEYGRRPEALLRLGFEWIAEAGRRDELLARPWRQVFPTVAPNEVADQMWAVIRTGPRYVLTEQWEHNKSACVAPVSLYHETITFRVCADSRPA